MTTDVHPKFMKEGDYSGALNIMLHASKDGKSGLLRRYPGFFKISGSDAGPNARVVGSVADKENNRVFYFVQNDIDEIWVTTEDSKNLVLRRNFRFGDFVSGGIIGDLLFFTDNINEPRCINVTNEYVNSYDHDFNLIKSAPIFPLYYTKFYAPGYSSLTGKAFMFSYRYVYVDNQISVLAPYTQMVYCEEPVRKIMVSRNLYEKVPNYVSKVELLSRSSDSESWRVFKTVTPENFEAMTEVGIWFDFNGPRGRALGGEALKPFENIPLKSKALEVAKDRVVLANNEEGHDTYEVPSFKTEMELRDTINDPEHLRVYKVTHEKSEDWTINPADPQVTKTVDEKYYVKKGSAYYFLVQGDKREYFNGVETSYTPGDYTGLETGLTKDTNDYVPQSEIIFNDFFSDYQYDRSFSDPTEHFVYLTLDDVFTVGETKFKNKSQYQTGIVFYDRNLRNQGVYTNENSIITVDDDFRNNEVRYMKWSVESYDNINIPDWAVAYQILRTDNLSRVTFIQGRTSDIYWVYGDSVSRQFRTDADFIEIDVSGSIKAGVRYNFTEGDLIDIYHGSFTTTLPIVSMVGSKIRVDSISFHDVEVQSPARFYYEIWREREGTTSTIQNGRELTGDIFYEVSEVYPVISPGTNDKSFGVTSGYLKGDVTVVETDTFDYEDSRTISEGKFENNDLEEDPHKIIIEAPNPDNNINIGWIKDLGRPNAVIDTGKVRKKNSIRWSNRLIQGTLVNGTSTFDFSDEDHIPVENGEINCLLLVSKQQHDGNVMLAICDHETSSIYLDETMFVDNQGSEVIGSSTRFIGSIQTLKGGYGTRHPQSVRSHGGKAWWWDVYSKKVVRYASNGIAPISDSGNRSLFHAQSGSPSVAYDPFHAIYFIGFSGVLTGYHDDLSQWRGGYSFIPDNTNIINESMIVFRNGEPYRSNFGDTYFGEPREAYIEFYSVNQSPVVLDNISLHLTEDAFEWDQGIQVLKDELSIDVTNDSGQSTDLVHTDFDVNESVAYSFFLRDKNSPGGLLQGYEMRSDIHKFKVNLRHIGIEYIIINETVS